MKTPQQSYPELNKTLGVEVYLKREDLHKYGSHKGRSIPLMIKKYVKEDGVTNFVISSSGNAALAAIHAVQAHNRNNANPLSLSVLVGKHISPQKLKVLQTVREDHRISIEQTDRPRQASILREKEGKAKNLRQSNDDTALIGYVELADELAKIPNLGAVFVPTSSGTTAQALGESFQKLGLQTQIHIVQTSACHPMTKEFDSTNIESKTSIAGAIVDNIALRKEKVLAYIKTSHGFGWIVNDNEIQDAMKLITSTCNLAISPNSAISVAGLKKALAHGHSIAGPVVCLITGQ